MRKHVLLIFILILLSLPSIISLFRPGFFQSDDGEWMIIRFSAFHQALRDGQFPVRFLGRLNYGFGYPVANFLYPGFMYLAELPKILGFGFVNSIKIILGLSMVASLIFSFLWLRKFFGKWEALVGGLFYLYAPYHLFDLYRRGSVGEVLALAIVPFILWMIEKRSLVFSSLGIAFLILAHNTLALLFLPIIIFYMLLDIFIAEKSEKLYAIRYTLYVLFLGLGLSAFFWIPAIFELRYTRFSQTQVSNWQNYFVDFTLLGWGTLVVFSFTILVFFLRKREVPHHYNDTYHYSSILLLFLLGGLGSIFLSLPQSSLLWQNLPVTFVQFPFRFLSVVVLSTAFLAAHTLNGLERRKKWLASLILVALLLFSAAPYIKPAELFDKGEGFYATNEGTTTVQDEYMPKWVKNKPTEHFKEKVEVVEGKADINNLIFNSKKVEFNISSQNNLKVRINTIYYPGWKASIDNISSEIQYNNDQGVMDISIPKGNHKIKLDFSETSLRLFADIISIVSFFVLILPIKIKRSSISRFIC